MQKLIKNLKPNPLRYKYAPEGSLWGEFGVDDQLGRMNLITDKERLAAAREVKVGKSFCLSLPLDVPGEQTLNPRRMPPQRFSTLRDGASSGQEGFCWPYDTEDPELTDVVNDDVVLMNTQYSTQWDSFAHMGSRFDADGDGAPEMVFYNGYRAGEHMLKGQFDPDAPAQYAKYVNPEAKALGIENLAAHGAQGRGVMIDLAHHIGRKREAVGYDAIMRILDADKITIESGDMVCIHTGFGEALLAMNKKPDIKHLHEIGSGLDGHDKKLLNWIVDVRLSCLISDNPAVELIAPKLMTPNPTNGLFRRAKLPLHEHCLFKCGIHLGELWYLTELANWLRANERHRFLLTAPPLRLPGAVGSPATPIATV